MKLNFFQWMPQGTDSSHCQTLLFLHGMGGTGQIWRGITAQLEDEYCCIAPDQRGHGGSRPVPPDQIGKFHASEYARDVVELLDLLGVEKVMVIGHSMGARTALALAHQIPDRVSALIEVDIGISSEWGGGIGMPLARFIGNLPETFPDRATLKEHLFRECPDPAIAQYLSAVAKKTSDSPETWVFPFEHQSLVQTIEQANEAPLADWLMSVLDHGVPVTYLRGERSKVWLKEDYEEQKAKFHHPLLEFQEWENCGHGLPFEQRARFIQFLKSKL